MSVLAENYQQPIDVGYSMAEAARALRTTRASVAHLVLEGRLRAESTDGQHQIFGVEKMLEQRGQSPRSTNDPRIRAGGARMLRLLADWDRGRIQDLEAALGIASSTVRDTAAILEELGLIERHVINIHNMFWTATDAGRRYLEAAPLAI